MYTVEERLKAVKLYIKYDCSPFAVIRELGYPSHNRLGIWYKEYRDSNAAAGDKLRLAMADTRGIVGQATLGARNIHPMR